MTPPPPEVVELKVATSDDALVSVNEAVPVPDTPDALPVPDHPAKVEPPLGVAVQAPTDVL